ncbi:GNAT family N-acetyltransferase [Chitinivibrio alkaliphilus]|uniref:GCN5-related N-acetyltransferase n=1 Tax=Chitinivibrio alkaliphilus ACht1 TaxID=1313304 RepID=U7DE32_9BACT|nr:GNAT family N-acetyltransferase [Chitinivibrio alkaliphilus]ERP39176.1 GCN5-related N-acetyltransferase [Chitinivibrio alkaliphilus ACht1]
MKIIRSESDFAHVADFQATIPEFASCCDDPHDILFRGDHFGGVVLEARVDNHCAGVLFGYPTRAHTWYNHITAVVPKFRGCGVGSALLDAFAQEATQAGATTLFVKSKNCFPSMIRLLVKKEYAIIGMEKEKILFEKIL